MIRIGLSYEPRTQRPLTPREAQQGNLRAIKLLTDRKKLAFCRDSKGLAPLNKAVFWTNRKNLIRNYSESVNSMDQSRRTPLDYMYKLMMCINFLYV
uniref:Uncharacterized protein n=1 Tax=Meloidogyne incognita TaxID=6306 RepID=A0A914NT39_MELIC